MNNQSSSQQHTDKKLEAETLFDKFKTPILIATFDGLKMVSVKTISRFQLILVGVILPVVTPRVSDQ